MCDQGSLQLCKLRVAVKGHKARHFLKTTFFPRDDPHQNSILFWFIMWSPPSHVVEKLGAKHLFRNTPLLSLRLGRGPRPPKRIPFDFPTMSAKEIRAVLPELRPRDYPTALYQMNAKGAEQLWPWVKPLEPMVRKNFSPIDIFYLFSMARQVRVTEQFFRALCLRAAMTEFPVDQCLAILEAIANKRRTKSKTKLYEEQAIRNLDEQVQKEMENLDGDSLARVLIVLGSRKIYDKMTLKRLCYELRKKATELDAKKVTLSLEALAILEIYHEDLIVELVKTAKIKLADFTIQEFASLMTSLEKFGVYDQELVTQIIHIAKEKTAEFKAADVAKMLYALSKFDVFDAELVARLVAFAHENMSQFVTQELATTRRALEAFGVNKQPSMVAFIKAAKVLENQRCNDRPKVVMVRARTLYKK